LALCFKENLEQTGKYALNFVKNRSSSELLKRLKLIPRVVDAPWIIRKTMSQVPLLVGKHLKLEEYDAKPTQCGFTSRIIDIHISAGRISSTLAKLCSSYKNNLDIELLFVVEGREVATLPEEVIGGVRFLKKSN
jgi:hypothetical protein